MMRVSIIIPVYNRKEYLREVLDRIQKQDYDKSLMQVIIVDNNSTDGTCEMLQSMKFEYDLEIVSIARENNFEAAKLRNRGAAKATGDLLLFVDSDILLPKDFISNHVSYYKSPDDLVSVIGSVYYLENKNYDEEVEKIYEMEDLPIDPLEKDYAIYNECGPTNPLTWLMYHSGNVSITKRAFNLAGGFDEWHREWSIEDLDFGYQLYKNGVRIFYSKYAYGLHKWHENTAKNINSVDDGFQYLIQKEDNNRLISEVYKNMTKHQLNMANHIFSTKVSYLDEYLQYKKIERATYETPILTIAIYSSSYNPNLFKILDELEKQNNSMFEVIIIDDSLSLRKDIEIQQRTYKFDLRLFHVNWSKEKKNYIMEQFMNRKLSKDINMQGIEGQYLEMAKLYTEIFEEELKHRFEQLVYNKAIGTYVKFMDDRTYCGSAFISEIWRDLVNQ